MKKFFYLILFIVGVGVLLISTCPDQQAHHDAIKGVVSEVVNSEVDQNSIFSTYRPVLNAFYDLAYITVHLLSPDRIRPTLLILPSTGRKNK